MLAAGFMVLGGPSGTGVVGCAQGEGLPAGLLNEPDTDGGGGGAGIGDGVVLVASAGSTVLSSVFPG